jgi:hypothetical protein
MQQQNNPDQFLLDYQIQLPKFVGKMNGEMVDSWIRSLSTYFNTCPGLTEERKLQIVSLQLEGLAPSIHPHTHIYIYIYIYICICLNSENDLTRYLIRILGYYILAI